MALREASRNDLGLVVAALADGFDADPMFRWMFEGAGFRKSLRGWLETVVPLAAEKGPCYLADEGAGAALWTEPGVALAGPDEFARIGEFLSATLGDRGAEVLEALAAVGAHKPEQPVSRHLVYIGVRRAERGRGLGAELIDPLLAACDADPAHAYLHSTNPQTQPFYEARGFSAIAGVAMPDGGPTITPMWRRPR